MIHGDHPFVPSLGDRDPIRRLRGRLVAPVTIFTAGVGAHRTGLTVSSLLVAEGDPALVYALVGPTTDLWEIAAVTGRFVIHVCQFHHRQLADVFAGLRPSPGGLFAVAATTDSDWGPVLLDTPDRAYCTLRSREEIGFSGVIVGEVDRVEVSDLTDPLIHFRSDYHRLG